MIERISKTHVRIFEYLNTYRFLTAEQMLRLGVAKHVESVRRLLRELQRDRSPIGKLEFAVHPKKGRLPNIYHLTKWGASILAELYRIDVSSIYYPKSVRLFQQDYFHRISTVDYHIMLQKWAEKNSATLIHFDTYFDKTGYNRASAPQNRLTAKTRVSLSGENFFVPDIIALLRKNTGELSLRTIEIHNGYDTGRFLRQMENHIQALEYGSITDKYKLNVACHVFWIFEHESTMKAAIKRIKLKTDWCGFQKYVHFILLDEVRKGNENESISEGIAS
jgi:hypothetical protein